MSNKSNYWENIFSQRGWGRYPPEELVRFISRTFGDIPDKTKIKVLEVGCGPGPNIWYLRREGYATFGIDGSSTAIKLAYERLDKENLNQLCHLEVGDFSSLPWGDLFFNAVIDIESLYANPIAIIKNSISEIYRVLSKEGVFFGKMFGNNTTGSNSGVIKEQESGTVIKPTIGPCKGNEVAHFFCYDELKELFSNFSEVKIDSVSRTDNAGAINIHEWLVTAKK